MKFIFCSFPFHELPMAGSMGLISAYKKAYGTPLIEIFPKVKIRFHISDIISNILGIIFLNRCFSFPLTIKYLIFNFLNSFL